MNKDIEKIFETRKILYQYKTRKSFLKETYNELDINPNSIYNYKVTINNILTLNRSNLFLPSSIFYFKDTVNIYYSTDKNSRSLELKIKIL